MKISDRVSRAPGRRLLLAVGFACAALAATTVAARGGLSYINLDSLLHDPRWFFALLVLPATVAAASVVTAMLPPVVTINLVITVCLLGLLETGAWLLAPPRPVTGGQPEAVDKSAFYVPDAALGYSMAPSTLARHRRTVDGRQIYDVFYRTDPKGRRETPTRGGHTRSSFLLFFGDSNTFGEGLSQTETLPYYAGEIASAFRPYNYGVSGWGPSQLLALARRGRLPQEVAERDGYAIYFLIPAHIDRVVGSSKVSTDWGRHFPYFEENARGNLVTNGNFVHGRPFTTLAYFFWTKSNLANYFGVDLPLWYSASDYRLTAKVFKDSGQLLARQLSLRGFVVILGQAYDDVQRRAMHDYREALAREGVPYLDYTQLFDTRDVRYRLSEADYHNSALANHIIATRLVADLIHPE
jgi:hypothetical protein